MQTFLESETSGRAGVACGEPEAGGGAVAGDLTFLSSAYLQQELNSLLRTAHSKPMW